MQNQPWSSTAGGLEYKHDPEDSKLNVRFHLHAVLDEAASNREGRPIYVEEEYVTIIIPGDRNEVRVKRAEVNDTKRFPQQYAAFKNGQAQGSTGTPLEHWPLMTRAQVEELKYFGITTVEHLAGMSDSNLQRFPNGHAMRQKAKDFLDAAKSDAPAVKMREELSQRDAEIAVLKRQMEEQVKALDELRKSKKG